MVLVGLGPYVMRRIINVWTETKFNSFSVAVVAGRVVWSLTVCTPEGSVSYVVFSFIYSQEWERRVVAWVVDLLCCAVGLVAPVGINCKLLPGLENVLASSSGRGTIAVVPLGLCELNKSLVDVSVRVMGGTDIHTMLNHLQTRMKEFMHDPVLLECPKLLQVNIVCVRGSVTFLCACVELVCYLLGRIIYISGVHFSPY